MIIADSQFRPQIRGDFGNRFADPYFIHVCSVVTFRLSRAVETLFAAFVIDLIGISAVLPVF